MSEHQGPNINQDQIPAEAKDAFDPSKAKGVEARDSSFDGKPWYNKPEHYGNAAGETVESTLKPVGDTVGKGLETVSKPVGSVVDTVVGGVMRSGEAFGKVAGVGYGNKDTAAAKNEKLEGVDQSG